MGEADHKAQFQQAVTLLQSGKAAESLEIVASLLEQFPKDKTLMRAEVRCLLALDKQYQAYERMDSIASLFGADAVRDLRDMATKAHVHQQARAQNVSPPSSHGNTGPPATRDGAVTITLPNGSTYDVYPSEHHVLNASRASERFKGKEYDEATSNVTRALAALVGMPVAAIVLGAIDASVSGDGTPLNTIALLILICWPFTTIAYLYRALKNIVWSSRAPKRFTPADTVRTFINSISSERYHFAANCLTDTARVDTDYSFLPRENYLDAAMPPPVYTSPRQAEAYFEKIPFKLKIVGGKKGITLAQLAPDVVKLTIQIQFGWEEAQSSGTGSLGMPVYRDHKEVIPSDFVLIESGGAWWICNGFLVPIGSKFTDEEAPTSYEEREAIEQLVG